MTIKINLVNTLLNKWKRESGFTKMSRIIIYPQSLTSESKYIFTRGFKRKD